MAWRIGLSDGFFFAFFQIDLQALVDLAEIPPKKNVTFRGFWLIPYDDYFRRSHSRAVENN